MSYIQPSTNTDSPFAQLRITSAPSTPSQTQWGTRSRTWVNSLNTADGNCIMWGLIAVVANYSGTAGVGSLKFTSTSNQYLYGQYEQGAAASRANSGEVMIHYGTGATWSNSNITGTSPVIDNDRNRCMLMRMEA